MDKSKTTQKKNSWNYIYALIVGMLVVACAVTIALINSNNISRANIGDDTTIPVSGSTYVVPMKDATIAKDYSASELQFNATLKQWEIHKAIDFVAGEDKNVYAVTSGTISNIYTNYLEGTVIEIAHKNGLISIYKSLNKEVNVKIGDVVSAGAVIGQVGETMAQELNNGAHLHFEMTKDGVKVNPNDYLDLGNK